MPSEKYEEFQWGAFWIIAPQNDMGKHTKFFHSNMGSNGRGGGPLAWEEL